MKLAPNIPQTAPKVQCPECGALAEASAPASRGRRAPSRLLPLLLLLAAIAAQLIGTLETAETSPFAVGPPTGPNFAPDLSLTLVEPGLNLPRLRSIAEGKGDGSLTRQVIKAIPWRQPERPGHARLVASFDRPDGDVTSTFRLGWPYPWIARTAQTTYDNVLTRSGPSSAPTGSNALPGPRVSWYSSGVYYIAGPTPSWADYWLLDFGGIASAVAVIAASWYAGRALAWLLVRWQPPRRRATRLVPAVIIAVASLCVVCGTIMTTGTSEQVELSATFQTIISTGPGPMPRPSPYGDVTSLTSDDIGELLPSPKSDATIARAILAAVARRNAYESLYLAIGFEEETQRQYDSKLTGWPWRLIRLSRTARYWVDQDGRATSATYGPGQTRIRFEDNSCYVIWGVTGPSPTRDSLSISVTNVALNGVCLWIVWMSGRGILWLWSRRTRARRRNRGQCLHCGYSLAGLAAT